MKLLVTLSLLQTACIVVLIVQLANDEDGASTPTPASPAAAIATDAAMHAASNAPTFRYPDETRLRQIIREELAAHLNSATDSAQANDYAPVEVRNETQNRYQKEFVAQQIEYYRSTGAISHVQMQDLQREIALLDQAGRREMLGRLVRAMNAGEIKGQL